MVTYRLDFNGDDLLRDVTVRATKDPCVDDPSALGDIVRNSLINLSGEDKTRIYDLLVRVATWRTVEAYLSKNSEPKK